MFTWRSINKRSKYSKYYFVNIINLLKNQTLINTLLNYNITLYFSLHHRVVEHKNKFQSIINLEYIKYIEENEIAECLAKANLIVTDFSSIIFDFIYRRKPFIIFIPDIYDPFIKQKYDKATYDVIKKFQLNKFKFKNICFDIDKTVNKIKYYIENEFQLDKQMSKFYDKFNFKTSPIMDKFINHLVSIK